MTQDRPADARPDARADAPAGVFVSFEGGDGAGKSTQVALLGHHLAERGREVVVTREPGGTPLGRELRQAVLHGEDLDPRTEALLYAADRAHHVASLVRPALARGAVVLTDRYLDSSVAYQGSGRGLGADEVERLSLWATYDLLPHVTVLLDLDPAVGLARLTGDPDRLESAGDAFHRRTRRAFLDRAAADPGRWLVLDATQPADVLAAAVRDRLAPLLAGADAGAGAAADGSTHVPAGGADVPVVAGGGIDG
ncbi:dTMP kinase [Cellulomonas sp. NPDC057328]|uniref:dTMP kinase n=1 Tax=Cellulomonas sp. NPDC057328 TaxID=3346101 RepID=UPI003638631C